MDLLARRCRDRSNQLESYVDTWQIDHKEAMQVCDLEELIEECLDVEPILRRAWSRVNELEFDESISSDLLFSGEALIRKAIEQSASASAKIVGLIEMAERAHYTIANASALRDTVHNLEILAKQAEIHSDTLDVEQVEESRADYRRGDYELAEDMLRELQGNGAESD